MKKTIALLLSALLLLPVLCGCGTGTAAERRNCRSSVSMR